jgi:hypothetical protein
VETHGDGVFEKVGVRGGTGLEEAGGLGRDFLAALKEMGMGIEKDGSSEGLEGRRLQRGQCCPQGMEGASFCQTVQVAGRLGMRTAVNAADELHGISAATTSEAVPEVSFKVYSEGSGIVPSV